MENAGYRRRSAGLKALSPPATTDVTVRPARTNTEEEEEAGKRGEETKGCSFRSPSLRAERAADRDASERAERAPGPARVCGERPQPCPGLV